MTDHVHEFVWTGEELLPCACGANHGAIQTMLGEAAEDARRVVGDDYYTGCWVRQELESLELWLCNAPSEVLQELEEIRPGTYLIHNDAPRPLKVVDDLRDSFDWTARKAEGIDVNLVGPTQDGYLQVGVEDDVEGAQAQLDAIYGADVVRVHRQGKAYAF